MFVPRQVQKKSTPSKNLTTNQPPLSLLPPQRAGIQLCPSSGIDIKTAKEMVMALEILLSNYSMEKVYGDWLRPKMRELEGKDDFIHLSTFMDCQFIAKMKPKPSQLSFARALVACGSDLLELSMDKYHVRRKENFLSFKDINQDDFSIYIEPNLTNISQNPGRVARVLLEAQLPQKYFPVQFVESTEKSWAFVTLSSVVSQADIMKKELWPKDWIVLAKSEWRRRDAEYQELRQAVRRVPIFYHQGSQQEMGESIHSRLVKVDAKNRAIMGPDKILSRVEGCPYSDIGGLSFEPGLIVRLMNLPPSTTKAAINSFVCRSVDRYVRKNKKQGLGEGDAIIGHYFQSVKINYVDYEKGLSQAYIRQRSQEDSGLITAALQKRKRKMRDGEDIKGKKVAKADGQSWVNGKVLTGEEERIYWEKLLSTKTKGKEKGKTERREEQPGSRPGIKRVRQDSEVTGPRVGKHIKFDE